MTSTPIGKHMVAHAAGSVWMVSTRGGDALLGMVEWHSRWRQYEFVPSVGTAFTHDCLTAMAEFLTARTAERLAAPRAQAGGS